MLNPASIRGGGEQGQKYIKILALHLLYLAATLHLKYDLIL
jgi:hypothetical protein